MFKYAGSFIPEFRNRVTFWVALGLQSSDPEFQNSARTALKLIAERQNRADLSRDQGEQMENILLLPGTKVPEIEDFLMGIEGGVRNWVQHRNRLNEIKVTCEDEQNRLKVSMRSQPI